MNTIVEDGEKVGEIVIVDRSFSWTYEGDKPEVSAWLGRIDKLTIEKGVETENTQPGETPTITVEALPENKYTEAIVFFEFTDSVELE